MKKPKPPRLTHPEDIKLGARIAQVRKAQRPRVSLKWLAQECGCTFVQIQKYEAGTNRVSWSRLREIARALDISVIELIRPICD